MIMVGSAEYIKYILMKNYKGLYKDIINAYKYKTIIFLYLLKIIENPIFFYIIYNARKINRIYEGHIWNSNFNHILKTEIRFMQINIILYILNFIPLVIYIFLLKIIKNFNSSEIVAIN